MQKELLLKVEHIYKSFGPTKALVDVSFEINRGEIRGLIGENGSGKSTVSSIIAGAQTSDSGDMFIKNKPYKPSSMIEAQKNRISMVLQEMGTIPTTKVADNIFVGKESLFTKYGIIQKKAMLAEAKKVLTEIGADDIDPNASIDSLNFEDRKIVEIARAMYNKPEIFVVDETTTALSQRGRDIVYKLMRKLQTEGKAVLFISHDLDELMMICNAITVLRDGIMIDTLERDEMNVDRMRTLMVGRELIGNYYRTDYDGRCSDEIVLKAEQITCGTVLENFFVELHKGEILGIGGLSDCGMHELGRILCGAERSITGKVVYVANGDIIDNSKTAIKNKIGYVSKNRDQEAIILNASIQDNLVLPSYDILKNSMGWISKKGEKKMSDEEIEVMSIKCINGSQYVSELSGGNKQKVVFGKWLANKTEIFILDCPTRGIDVGVKSSMYDLIYQFKQEEKSVVLISEELPELIGMCDKILILKDGKKSGEFIRSESLSENDIIGSMI